MSLAPRVHILTLGCPKNEADSRAMAERLAADGYALEPDPDDADILVVNTCSFIEEATQESIDTVLEAVSDWKPGSPDRRLVVAGCLPARYRDELAPLLPEVDAFVPVDEEASVPKVLASLGREASGEPAGEPSVQVGPFAYVNVCDGCDRECSFCTIPSIRGSFRSRSESEVLAEARRLARSGAREIVLVGQDVSSWGRDIGGHLPSLVRLLGAVPEIGWLRLMYLQPDGVTAELLDAMASSDSICRYLDIPLQHVSSNVLRAMARRGDAETFLDLISEVRAALPGVVLRTTLIAGFPGETDDDVDSLVEFIREAALDHVGVFPYSREEGTPAADLPGQLPAEEARDRARLLRDAADEASLGRLRTLRGSTLMVLVEGDEDGRAIGRWYGQAPEVDGVVYLDSDPAAGTFVLATIEDAVGHDLIATVTT